MEEEKIIVPIPSTDYLTREVALLLKKGDKLVFSIHRADSKGSPKPISIGEVVDFKELSYCEQGKRIRLEGFRGTSVSNWNFEIECFKLYQEESHDSLIINQTKENGKQNIGKVIEVQRITPSIRREETRRGSAVSGRISKTAIGLGHLGNRKAIGY